MFSLLPCGLKHTLFFFTVQKMELRSRKLIPGEDNMTTETLKVIGPTVGWSDGMLF